MKVLNALFLTLLSVASLSAFADNVALELRFDDYPADISFKISQNGVSIPFDAAASATQGSPAGDSWGNFSNDELENETLLYVWDLPVGDYEFLINDSYGDGLCCNEGAGGYSISVNGDVVHDSPGTFGSSETHAFNVAVPVVLELRFDEHPADISFQIAQNGVSIPFDAEASATQGSPVGDSWGNFSDDELADETIRFVWYFEGGDYELLINDSYGDGLCCDGGPGGYSIIVDGDVVYDSPGTFTSSDTQVFTVAIDDDDNDGLDASFDNCSNVANANQYDSDGDGYGNACDADIALPNDCVVNVSDLGVLRAAFFARPSDATWNADADLNGDGVVNVVDLGQMRAAFFAAPGPSGRVATCP
ncbi:MAG: hypothetical protein AB8G16_07955 [Gammaproteobacteria bacterium]